VSGRPGADLVAPYALRLGDDALILGHRVSEWCGRAPLLEEEMALANLGLDLIGQARSLYTLAGAAEGRGRDEDALAYRRDEQDFTNLLLVEQPNGDFAHTMVRHLLFAAWAHPMWAALERSAEPELAAIAGKAVKELAYHVRHAASWVVRLGDGTAESRARVAAALEALWPYTGEMLERDPLLERAIAAGIAADPAALRPAFAATVARTLAEAGLARPADGWMQTGGRRGRHSEHLGHLLAVMQVVHRAHPGAAW
jgi:ring-1,2-phenylacetyl-CoA epoxidase subunit PaaC